MWMYYVEGLLFHGAKISQDLFVFKAHGKEPKGIIRTLPWWWSNGINMDVGQELGAVDGISTCEDEVWLYLK